MMATAAAAVTVEGSTTDNIQPLSTLKMQAAQVAMDSAAVIHGSPDVLGKNVSTLYKRKTCCWVGSSTREASPITWMARHAGGGLSMGDRQLHRAGAVRWPLGRARLACRLRVRNTVIGSSRQLKVDHLLAVMMKIPHGRSGAV